MKARGHSEPAHPLDDARLEAVARLVRRARRGDRAAFDGLVERHLAATWKAVWRIVRSREDAEDVVQDVFVTAWQRLGDLEDPRRFSGWLARIATTRALNHVERAEQRLRRAAQSLDAPDGSGREPVARLVSPAPSPLRALERDELLRRLAACLDELPGAWRAVLALREHDGLAYDEIARRLDLALGTVRSRLARARLALRDCLAEDSAR
ncbi:MAG: sigma-70 family RNA polymerase sigma factor [Acidobacteria bacterium]|nr:MAG: sigma-70 family RNA polymerase sigma factor [Acidobacteriota bacterium]